MTKLQTANFKQHYASLKFGIWILAIIYNLDFGIWCKKFKVPPQILLTIASAPPLFPDLLIQIQC